MRGDYRLTTFASGCGDSILIEAHDKVVMIDIHYRVSRAQDDKDDEAPDFASDIRQACGNDHLDVFVSTHPDKDMSGASAKSSIAGRPRPGTAIPKIPIPRSLSMRFGAVPTA